MKNRIKIIFLMLFSTILILTGCSSSSSSNSNNSSNSDAADKAFSEHIDLTGINKDKKSDEENGNRIVMDSVALSELAEKLDIKLAGVPTTKLGRMPERYSNIRQVGMAMNPDLEVIKSINPTMVYIPDSLIDWVKSGFEKNNIPHKFVNLRSVDSLFNVSEDLAKTYGKEDKLISLKTERDSFFKEYNEKIKNKKKPKVLLLMGLPGSYVAATEKSYVGNLLKLSGAENVIKNTNEEFVQVNLEEVLAQDPDYILRTAHALPDVVMKMFQTEFSNNKTWSHFRAVKENKVIDLDSNIFGMTAQFDYSKGINDLYNIFYNK